ncbi:MAG: hypothetical protein ABSC18_12595 [Verrucomicrobiota bacterium]|jgi:hypothetical protein
MEPRTSQGGNAATKLNWPQENARITKKKQHKFLSMCSLHCTPSKSLRFAKIFTTDGTDGTDDGNAEGRRQTAEFLSVKSVKSVVQFLWLRLAALRSFAAKIFLELRDFSL